MPNFNTAVYRCEFEIYIFFFLSLPLFNTHTHYTICQIANINRQDHQFVPFWIKHLLNMVGCKNKLLNYTHSWVDVQREKRSKCNEIRTGNSINTCTHTERGGRQGIYLTVDVSHIIHNQCLKIPLYWRQLIDESENSETNEMVWNGMGWDGGNR